MLPNDMLCMIFNKLVEINLYGYVHISQICSARLVCKDWKHAMDNCYFNGLLVCLKNNTNPCADDILNRMKTIDLFARNMMKIDIMCFTFNNTRIFNDTLSKYVKEVSVFGSINLANLNVLKNMHSLKLCELSELSDVSMFGKVRKLVLFGLPNVTDVSMLGNVYELELVIMNNLEDVSKLGDVHTLTLIDLPKVFDVSNLKNNHTLILMELPSLISLCHNTGLRCLTVRNLPDHLDLSIFRNIPTLEFTKLG